METTHERFFLDLFKSTGGFVPSWPLGKKVVLGDLIVMKKGRFYTIGNISDRNLYTEFKVSPYVIPDAQNWQLSSGIQSSFKSANSDVEENWTLLEREKAVLRVEFENNGSYLLSCANPKYVRIDDFNKIRKELVRKLSAEIYSFKKIFVVTEVAEADAVSVSIASHANGFMEISSERDIIMNAMDLHLYSHDIKMERFLNVPVHFRKEGPEPMFFKAKKLGLKDHMREQLIHDLLKSEGWKDHPTDLANLIDNDLVDVMPPVAIYAGSANEFFGFSNMNASDLNELF